MKITIETGAKELTALIKALQEPSPPHCYESGDGKQWYDNDEPSIPCPYDNDAPDMVTTGTAITHTGGKASGIRGVSDVDELTQLRHEVEVLNEKARFLKRVAIAYAFLFGAVITSLAELITKL